MFLLACRCCVFFHQQHLRQHLWERTLKQQTYSFLTTKRSLICSQRPFLMIYKLLSFILSVLPQVLLEKTPTTAEKINAKISNKTVRTSLSSNYSMVIKVLVILVLIISFSYKVFTENNTPLKILTPKTQTNAVRFLPIEGTAKYATENNIKQVWVVVRSKQSGNCYVQAPIQIKKNGDWKGYVIIGSEGNGDIGFTYEIRAYLNPLMKIKDGDILKSWPSAGVSTETVDVIRGENLVAEL